MRRPKELFFNGIAPLYKLHYNGRTSYLFGSCNGISLNQIYRLDKSSHNNDTDEDIKKNGRLVKRLLSHKSLAIERNNKPIKWYNDIVIQVIHDVISEPIKFMRYPHEPSLKDLRIRYNDVFRIVDSIMDNIVDIRNYKCYEMLPDDSRLLEFGIFLHFEHKSFPISSLMKFNSIEDFNHLIMESIIKYMGMDYNLIFQYRNRPIFRIYESDDEPMINGHISDYDKRIYQMIYDRYNNSITNYFSSHYGRMYYDGRMHRDEDGKSCENENRSYKIFNGIDKYHHKEGRYHNIDDILFVIPYDHLLSSNRDIFKYLTCRYEIEVYDINADEFINMKLLHW